MSSLATRASAAAARRRLEEGFEEFFMENGATHALTISLGLGTRTPDPEGEMLRQMRRIARRITRELRRNEVPRRALGKLDWRRAPWMAGFYEGLNRGGEIVPHWHGVLALRPGEELSLRCALQQCVGRDASFGPDPFLLSDPTRPVISTPGAHPSFHLTDLTTASNYISYATKKYHDNDASPWTIADFLNAA